MNARRRPLAVLLTALLSLPALGGPAFGGGLPGGSSLGHGAIAAAPTVAAAARTMRPSDVYRHTLKSVALIYTQDGDSVGKGTGWVLDAKRGLIVTNQHVVGDADTVYLVYPKMENGRLRTDAEAYDLGEDGFTFDDDTPTGTVLHSDVNRDLALIQTDAIPEGTQSLTLADRQVWPGERVHTIAGWPQGSESLWIYGAGTVRQVSQRTLANGVKTTVMESDALINRGNSGGPVVDDAGELVAVVEGYAGDARGISLFVGLDAVHDYLGEALPLVEPKTAEDYLKLAESHQAAFRLDRAIAAMSEAVRLAPEHGCYVAIRGLMFAFHGDFDTAKFDLDDAVRMAPNDSRVQGAYGEYHVMLGDYATAVQALTRAIRNDPANAKLYALRGTAQKELGELPAADRDLTRSLNFAPDNARTLIARGEVHRLSGDIEAALDDHKAAVNLDPRNPEGWDQIGLDLYADKQFEKAAEFHGEAIKRDATVALYHFHNGDALQEAGKWESGLMALNRAIGIDPNHAPSWHYAGLSLANMDDDKSAENAYRKAVQLDPNYAAARHSLAVLLRRTGQEAEARQQFAAAAAINPSFADPQAETNGTNERRVARPVAPVDAPVDAPAEQAAGLTSMRDLAGTWRAVIVVDGERVTATAQVDASGKYVTRYQTFDGFGNQNWTDTERGQMYLDKGDLLIGDGANGFTRHAARRDGNSLVVSYETDVIAAGRVVWTLAN